MDTSLRNDRDGFARLLPPARYFRLNAGGKSPAGRLKGVKHPSVPPKNCEGYGIILPPNLAVLDIDTHENEGVEARVRAFNHLLGLNLEDTLTVETSSGGRHFYIRVPESVDLTALPNGSIRYLESVLRENPGFNDELGSAALDTDFKLGKPGMVSYVVGPGSARDGLQYMYSGTEILELPASGVQALIGAKRTHVARAEEAKAARREEAREKLAQRRVEREGLRPLGNLSRSVTRVASTKGAITGEKDRAEGETRTHFDPLALKNARASLTEYVELYTDEVTFHMRRARIFALMQCCYDDAEIASMCTQLKIDWDTYTDSQLDYGTLLADISRLRAKSEEPEFHGSVCSKGGHRQRIMGEDALENGLRTLAEKITSRNLSRRGKRTSHLTRTTVVDLAKATTALEESTRRGTQKLAHASMILECVIQPILNAGGDRVVMSRDFLSRVLGLTSSQSAKALELLRTSGVLALRDRQRTGSAATYSLASQFEDQEMSETLALERQLHALTNGVLPAIVVGHNSTMVLAHTGEILAGQADIPDEALEVALSYSTDEAAARAEGIGEGEFVADEADIRDEILDLVSHPELFSMAESEKVLAAKSLLAGTRQHFSQSPTQLHSQGQQAEVAVKDPPSVGALMGSPGSVTPSGVATGSTGPP